MQGYIFLFLHQNIDCGYSLEPPRRGSLEPPQREPTIYILSKNKKNIKIFLTKFSIFTMEKNLCILHGQVFMPPTSKKSRGHIGLGLSVQSVSQSVSQSVMHE